MSASREKKKRQELLAGGAVDPKAARAAEEKAAARKTNILYGTLGIIFVVLAAVLLFYNSSFYTRGRTAVTVDGEKFTVAEATYYYGQAYRSFLSSDTGYMMMLYGMLDTSQPLSSQTCSYDSSITWADYFKNQAVDSMRFVHAAVKAAEAEGMSLGDEDMASFDENVQSMKDAAGEAGYSYSGYLSKVVFGPNVTTSVFESCLKQQLLADKYAQAYQDSLTYTEEEIGAYYTENRNNYDYVDGAYVILSATAESTTDEDGNTVSPTDEENAAALEQARSDAQAILDACQEGGDLEELTEEYGGSYYGSDEMTYSSSVTGEWLFDGSRKAGDMEILENDGSTVVYVALFNSRERREEPATYDVRHILITSANLDLGEDEEATQEQLEAKAQEILDSWDGTEEGFASLAETYSQDGGSNTNGGLYEDVPEGQMIAPFEDWCYEEGRKPGDTGIVYYASTGAHIMYFVGYNEDVYWHWACKNALTSNDYNDWYTTMTDSVTAEVNENAMSMI